MKTLEKKVDAIARSLLANDYTDRNHALAELRVLMEASAGKPMDADTMIRSALKDLGVPDHLKGQPYLISALEAVVADPDIINAITGELYPKVAEIHCTTASRVERAIRHAIDVGWDRADLETEQEYFGSTVSALKGKPTNGEFIARVANVLRQRMES